MSLSSANGTAVLQDAEGLALFIKRKERALKKKGLFGLVGTFVHVEGEEGGQRLESSDERDARLLKLAEANLALHSKLTERQRKEVDNQEAALERMDNEVQEILMVGLADDQQREMEDMDALEMWEHLPKLFGGQTRKRRLLMEENLRRLTLKGSGGDITTFLAAARKTWGLYTSAGGEMSEKGLMELVLTKLKKDKASREVFKSARTDLLSAMDAADNGGASLSWLDFRETLVVAEAEAKDDDVSSDSDDGATTGDPAKAAPVSPSTESAQILSLLTAMVTNGDGGFGGGVGRRGRGSGSGGGGRGGARTKKVDKTCFNWRDTGKCRFGDGCRFNHDGSGSE